MHMADELSQDSFLGTDEHSPHLRFHWVPMERLDKITTYPHRLHALLCGKKKHVVRQSCAQSVK